MANQVSNIEFARPISAKWVVLSAFQMRLWKALHSSTSISVLTPIWLNHAVEGGAAAPVVVEGLEDDAGTCVVMLATALR